MALFVDNKELAKALGQKSISVIKTWRDKGMPFEKDGRNYKYNILESILWYQKNISFNSLKINREYEDTENMAVDDQLKIKRMEKLDLEMAIIRGEYIPIEDVDNTTSSMVSLLISKLRQNMRILPKILSKKTETQIKKALDAEYKNMIEDIENTLKSEKNDSG